MGNMFNSSTTKIQEITCNSSPHFVLHVQFSKGGTKRVKPLLSIPGYLSKPGSYVAMFC